jgi:trigger factor
VKAVKEREPPALDDAFASVGIRVRLPLQNSKLTLSSASLVLQSQNKARRLPRSLVVEKLLADIEIPVPDEVVLDEVNAHLEGEGRLEDAEHRAEVDGQVRSSIKSDFS